LGLRTAETFGVHLAILVAGNADWVLPVVVGAALIAVGGYAVQLGVPRNSMVQSALLGAAGWTFYAASTTRVSALDPAIATFVASMLIGAAGRLLARRQDAPSALFVVPAILPLLPGLLLVRALLATTDAARVSGLIDATTTAFLVGTGVASGDVIVATIRRVRDRILGPAVGAIAEGVDVLVVAPVSRVLATRPDAAEHEEEGDPQAPGRRNRER